MNILDRIFAGRIIKDYGPIEERFFGLGCTRTSLLLAERGGKARLVFKFSAFFICGASAHYFPIPLDKAETIRGYLDDAEKLIQAKPSHAKTVNPHGELA